MRIEITEDRNRLWENLCEATGENARSKALDQAARYYLRMCGGVAADGRGDIQTLLDAAEEEEGSLTASQIAAILDEPRCIDIREPQVSVHAVGIGQVGTTKVSIGEVGN